MEFLDFQDSLEILDSVEFLDGIESVWFGMGVRGRVMSSLYRKYLWVGGGMKQCLLRSRPPVSEIEIELEMT